MGCQNNLAFIIDHKSIDRNTKIRTLVNTVKKVSSAVAADHTSSHIYSIGTDDFSAHALPANALCIHVFSFSSVRCCCCFFFFRFRNFGSQFTPFTVIRLSLALARRRQLVYATCLHAYYTLNANGQPFPSENVTAHSSLRTIKLLHTTLITHTHTQK